MWLPIRDHITNQWQINDWSSNNCCKEIVLLWFPRSTTGIKKQSEYKVDAFYLLFFCLSFFLLLFVVAGIFFACCWLHAFSHFPCSHSQFKGPNIWLTDWRHTRQSPGICKWGQPNTCLKSMLMSCNNLHITEAFHQSSIYSLSLVSTPN